MLIIFDEGNHGTRAHRDHNHFHLCHDFIWLRINFEKEFFILNPNTGEKKYIESHSAWFDTVNQFHGEVPKKQLTYSVRIDGIFADEFRSQIPVPPIT